MDNYSFLIRKPITDATLQVLGCEFTPAPALPVSASQVVAQLLADRSSWPPANKLLFTHADLAVLDDPILDQAPANALVLVLPRDFPYAPERLNRCKELKLQGIHFAIDYDAAASNAGYGPIADFFFFDAAQGMDALMTATTELGRSVMHYIARGIQSAEQFQMCRNAGIGRFEGDWFVHPALNEAKTASSTQSLIIELLNKVQQDVDDKDLELLFKRDPALSFRMLEYINAAGFGLGCEVESIRHAIQILGRNELFRWLTVLLVSEGAASAPVLRSRAVLHGRFMELLGEGLLGREDRARLFIVGIFSLLDVMLEMPMGHVLDNIQLPESIIDALVTRQGIYAPFLKMVEACEADGRELESLSLLLGLSAEKVNKAHLDAIAWVEANLPL